MTKQEYTLDNAVRDICSVPHSKSKTREIIKKFHIQETEKIREILEKERATWARGSIGERAVRSVISALDPSLAITDESK